MLTQKIVVLEDIFGTCSVLVAFSRVDSTFLLNVAYNVLADNVLAVTASSHVSRLGGR